MVPVNVNRIAQYAKTLFQATSVYASLGMRQYRITITSAKVWILLWILLNDKYLGWTVIDKILLRENHGQKLRKRQRRTRWFTWQYGGQCMAEMKQNKLQQVLAYRKQVPWSGWVLESFLGYSGWLPFVKAWLIQYSLLHRLEIQFLHPN